MSDPSWPAPGEIYEHYKKKNYRVFSMGLDASRQENIVIYQALYPTDYVYFSRPLAEWNDQVLSLDGSGLVPRFRKIEQTFMSTNFPYRTRRTVKPDQMDRKRDISRELLLDILEDAHWAPTHGLTQPWRFHVFTADGRNRLTATLQALYDQTTAEAEFRPEKRAKLRDSYIQAPVIIAVTAQVDGGGKVSKMDEICATACAVQNLLLSAHQRGIGSFWATPPVSCSPEFRAWLGLDSTHICLGLVLLGYPIDGSAPKSIRVPLLERVIFCSTT